MCYVDSLESHGTQSDANGHRLWSVTTRARFVSGLLLRSGRRRVEFPHFGDHWNECRLGIAQVVARLDHRHECRGSSADGAVAEVSAFVSLPLCTRRIHGGQRTYCLFFLVRYV